MPDAFSRTELVLGSEAMDVLASSKVAVFGIGGVGSFVAEALARSGVGAFVLVDDDRVCLTNLNRQIIALRSTVGRPKVEVMRDRILDINPRAEVEVFQEFYNAESAPRILRADLSYVVDCIDTVSSKIDLILRCRELGIPILSSMGTGNKLDPTRLELADISKTSVCPLARVMRQELRKRGVRRLQVLYSREPPIKVHAVSPAADDVPRTGKRSVPGSVAFVPPAAGLILASRVVRDLIGAGTRSNENQEKIDDDSLEA